MYQDSAGRYVTQADCTWSVSGDHIAIDSGVPLGPGRRLAARLSKDGRSLELGLDENGKFTTGTGGGAAALHRQ
jgi:hypothetical protein